MDGKKNFFEAELLNQMKEYSEVHDKTLPKMKDTEEKKTVPDGKIPVLQAAPDGQDTAVSEDAGAVPKRKYVRKNTARKEAAESSPDTAEEMWKLQLTMPAESVIALKRLAKKQKTTPSKLVAELVSERLKKQEK